MDRHARTRQGSDRGSSKEPVYVALQTIDGSTRSSMLRPVGKLPQRRVRTASILEPASPGACSCQDL